MTRLRLQALIAMVTLTGFEYFTSSSDPDCSDDYGQLGFGDWKATTTTSVTHNYYVCFRAKNNLNVYGAILN